MLEDVDANDNVERRGGERKRFAGCHEIVYRDPAGAGMEARRVDCCRRGIDAGDRRSTGRHGFRHEATAAAEIEHALAAPVANDRIENREARWHHPAQRLQPARLVAPPVRAVDRQVVASAAGPNPGKPEGDLARVRNESGAEPLPEARLLHQRTDQAVAREDGRDRELIGRPRRD
jgi:hypothetical protein